MLKQRNQLFEFFFVSVDLFVVTIAWFLSYWLRFMTDVVPVLHGVPPLDDYGSLIVFIWLIWAFVFKRSGLYKPMRAVRRTREIFLLINANALALLVFIAVVYLFKEKSNPYSRLVFVYFGALTTFGTIFQRTILRAVLREVRRRGHNLRYMLIVGAGKLSGDIARRVRSQRELGIQVVGCLTRDGGEVHGPEELCVVGSYDDLEDVLKRIEVDQLVVALPLEDNHRLPEIMTMVGDSLVDLKIVPDVHEFVQLGSAIEEFDGLPVVTIASSPLEGVNLIAKRAVDIVFSSFLLVVLSPLLLLIALLVKCTSRGPVVYKQERLSIDGTPFSIFKFRTMRIDAEEQGPGWTTKGDARVTPIGAFLRKTSLDEFPQLFNVFIGDMSIVGPRPERPVFIGQFRQHIPKYMLRHKVPAGMTGWAQVHGWRGDTSIERRIEHDLYYIENWSLLLDIKILCMTIFSGFKNRNAY